MKRTGNLFDSICSPEALAAAWRRASQHKRAHRACYQFSRNAGSQIQALSAELAGGTYRPQPLNRFMVCDGRKPRLIEAPAFRDLVVQHVVYAAITPTLERRYIDTSFACRIGKGTHAAADWLQAAIRRATRDAWTLHVDVRKFFYSIDRGALRALLERLFKCRPTLDLMMLFAMRDAPTGVPIGNLLSQTFSNVYLNSLDHYCKRALKAADYGRYMDDAVMVAPSREVGLAWLAAIRGHLALLGLEISHYALQPVRRGCNWVGFRTWASARFVRPLVITRARADVRAGRLDSFASRLGHARRTCSHRPLVRYFHAHRREDFSPCPR